MVDVYSVKLVDSAVEIIIVKRLVDKSVIVLVYVVENIATSKKVSLRIMENLPKFVLFAEKLLRHGKADRLFARQNAPQRDIIERSIIQTSKKKSAKNMTAKNT